MATFDIAAATPVASTALAAGDRFAFDDVSDTPDSWDAIEADDLLDGLLRVADSTGTHIIYRVSDTLAVRQPSGTAGTDEVRISHDGTDAIINNRQTGGLIVYQIAGTERSRLSATLFQVDNDATIQWSGRSKLASPADGIIRAFRTDGTTPAWIQNTGGTSFVATDHTNNTTTPTAITNLTATVIAGRKYAGELVLFCDNTVAADGLRVDFDGGTATMTTFEAAVSSNVQGATFSVTISAALATDIIATTTGVTTRLCVVIKFGFVVNAAGTFIPRAGLEAASTGVLTTRVGSYMLIQDAP